MTSFSTGFMLVLTAVTVTQWSASQFAFDFPQIFEAVLIEQFNVNAQQIGVLYSVTAAPNLVINLLATLVISHCGEVTSALLFQSTVFIGVVLTYLAVTQNQYYLMVAGRVFIGIAFDVTYLTQAICLEKWFSGSSLTIVFGLGRSACYFMSFLSVYLLPAVYLETRNLQAPIMLIAYYSVLIFILTAIYVAIDFKYGQRKRKKRKGVQRNLHNDTAKLSQPKTDLKSETTKIFTGESLMDAEKTFELRHLRYTKPKSWVMFGMGTMYIHMYFQFTNTATDLFMIRFGLSYEEAKDIISIFPLVNAIFIPVFSSLYGKFGNKPLGLFLGALIGCGTYLTMTLFPSKNAGYLPYVAVGMISLFFCMVASCLTPSLVISFPKQAVGRLLASQATLLNCFSVVLPIAFGYFYGPRTVQAYQNMLYALAGYCGFCAVIGFVHFLMDVGSDSLLTMPENCKKVRRIQEKMSQDFVLSVLRRDRTENATMAGTGEGAWRSVSGTGKVSQKVEGASEVDGDRYSKMLTSGTSQFVKTPAVGRNVVVGAGKAKHLLDP